MDGYASHRIRSTRVAFFFRAALMNLQPAMNQSTAVELWRFGKKKRSKESLQKQLNSEVWETIIVTVSEGTGEKTVQGFALAPRMLLAKSQRFLTQSFNRKAQPAILYCQ
jgi:hypothetical protein